MVICKNDAGLFRKCCEHFCSPVELQISDVVLDLFVDARRSSEITFDMEVAALVAGEV